MPWCSSEDRILVLFVILPMFPSMEKGWIVNNYFFILFYCFFIFYNQIKKNPTSRVRFLIWFDSVHRLEWFAIEFQFPKQWIEFVLECLTFMTLSIECWSDSAYAIRWAGGSMDIWTNVSILLFYNRATTYDQYDNKGSNTHLP